LATFVAVTIRDCHRSRLRAGPAELKALTEAWTGTSLTELCGRIVTFPDENRGTFGVRSPDEHANESRTTLCRSGSSEAVRVSSEGTRFLTMYTRPVMCFFSLCPCGLCRHAFLYCRFSPTACFLPTALFPPLPPFPILPLSALLPIVLLLYHVLLQSRLPLRPLLPLQSLWTARMRTARGWCAACADLPALASFWLFGCGTGRVARGGGRARGGRKRVYYPQPEGATEPLNTNPAQERSQSWHQGGPLDFSQQVR